MKRGSAQRGNSLLVILSLILVVGAIGFMVYGFQKGQTFKANGPVVPVTAEVRGTKIGEPVVAPTVSTNANKPKDVASISTTVAATPAATTNITAKPLTLEKVVTGEGREYFTVGFDVLSGFEYLIPDDSTNKVAAAATPKDQIPATVRSLNKKQIALKGFMLPLKVEGGLITELLIMRDQSMCCYGAVPKINEWVSVKMTSKGIKPIMDQAVTLYGTLKVGEIRENGYLVGIYEMDGDKMAGPLDM